MCPQMLTAEKDGWRDPTGGKYAMHGKVLHCIILNLAYQAWPYYFCFREISEQCLHGALTPSALQQFLLRM